MNLTGQIPVAHLSSHNQRLLDSLKRVASTLGADHSAAAAHWLEHWGRLVALEGAVDATQSTHREVGRVMPCFAELVFSLRGDALRVGWMSGGRNGAHLAETVASLLHGTLAAHLTVGGDSERAQVLGALFGAAFPNLERLREMSALAQVFLVGVAPDRTSPDGKGHTLKLYFNPRVSSGDPVEHLQRLVERAGVDRGAFLELVECAYGDRGRSTHLYGIGIDLAESRPARVKLYVRVPRAASAAALDRMDTADRGAISAFINRFDHPSLTENLELALALDGGRVSMKATQFWAGKLITRNEEGEVLSWLSQAGCETAALKHAFDALRAPSPPRVQCSPLHAVGIEIVGSLKANVYAQPEL